DAVAVVNNSGIFSRIYDAWAALRNVEWMLPVTEAATPTTSGTSAARSRASTVATPVHCAATSSLDERVLTPAGHGRLTRCRGTFACSGEAPCASSGSTDGPSRCRWGGEGSLARKRRPAIVTIGLRNRCGSAATA